MTCRTGIMICAGHTYQTAYLTKQLTAADLGFYKIQDGVPRPAWGREAARPGLRTGCNDGGLARMPQDESLMLDKLTRESFAPHVGTTFEITVSDRENVKLELVEASAMGAKPQKGRQAFSCLFRGPNVILSQQIYLLKHPELGEMQLFLVPVAHDTDQGATLYEAVFT